MCGIAGYIGPLEAKNVLIESIQRLEYRGYDSAGIAVISEGQTHRKRAAGKLLALKQKLQDEDFPSSHLGIAHTRWATHGVPNEANAHPHYVSPITLAHNGIIENYLELREDLKKQGAVFYSDTDSEILAHLVVQGLKSGISTRDALLQALKKVRGSYAVVLIHEKEPDVFYVARQASPLVVGLGQGENFVASDVPALLPFTRQVVFLKDGECAAIRRDSVEIFNASGEAIPFRAQEITWNLSMAEKGGYKHFMLKEIYEQSRSITNTLSGRIQASTQSILMPELEALFPDQSSLKNLNKIYLIACGTSWHAALTARYFLEPWSKVPVMVEAASEFRYRNPLLDEHTLVIAVSQSGETADTLAAVQLAKSQGAKILSVCNVVGSSLSRESDQTLYTYAGPEIGVAATKTFTTQLAVLELISLWFGITQEEISTEEMQQILQELLALPQKIDRVFEQASSIQSLALRYGEAQDCLFIGRGPSFPIALEGALKLKEISYLHAEGYSAGELKHGPLALISKDSPVLALMPRDAYFEKMLSNVQELLARQASVLAVMTEENYQVPSFISQIIFVPKAHPLLQPILLAIPLQLFAYFIADHKGHDVDQPRNLAKSVTVE